MFDFQFPDVGEGIHEGKLVEWLVKVGDPIGADQPFARVETDKAVVDLPAPKAGTVAELLARPGDTIHVGQVIIRFHVAGETSVAAPAAPPVAPPSPVAPTPVTPPPAAAAAIPAAGGDGLFPFQFPDVGEGIHEGKLVEWLVKVGDPIGADQPFARVETDKAVVDLPAPKAGTVHQLLVAPGNTIHVGDTIIVFRVAGGASTVGVPATVASAPVPPATIPASPAPASAAHAMLASTPASVASAPVALGPILSEMPLATPRTRKLARQLGVDLRRVPGSGKHGRITDEDVEKAARGLSVSSAAATASLTPTPLAPASAPAQAPTQATPTLAASTTPPPAPAVPPPGGFLSGPVKVSATMEVERVPVSQIRKTIAAGMRATKQISAHVTHVDEADVTELLAWHGRLKAAVESRHGQKLSLGPVFAKILVAALKDFPRFNASYDETTQELVLKKRINLGVAVDTPEGLIVPVVKDADRKDLLTLGSEIAALAKKARERSLSLDDLRDGTFTLSNLGTVGGLFATPLIRQPELAIVSTHAIREEPRVVSGQIVVRKVMYWAISFDHRIIDGADAARFMNRCVELCREPELLVARL